MNPVRGEADSRERQGGKIATWANGNKDDASGDNVSVSVWGREKLSRS